MVCRLSSGGRRIRNSSSAPNQQINNALRRTRTAPLSASTRLLALSLRRLKLASGVLGLEELAQRNGALGARRHGLDQSGMATARTAVSLF
jgi:hypothetical protein